MQKQINRFKAIGWAISLAWHFNKKMLLVWVILISLVSLLPAAALYYNKQIILFLDQFTTFGTGSFGETLPAIIFFGLMTALMGLSNRFNTEFIYSVIFDSYYFGMEELLMDSVQNFSMEELLSKDEKDEYYACVGREGALTDVISGLCTLLGKFVETGSLLIVAFFLSKFICFFSLIYIAGTMGMNLTYVEKIREDLRRIRNQERLADYCEQMPARKDYAKELRVFQTGEKLISNWRQIYDVIYGFEIKNGFAMELRAFISGIGFYLFLLVMILYSLFRVSEGTLTPALLLVLFTLCINIFSSISGIARTLMYIEHGLYAIERQYRIFGKRCRPEKMSLAAECRAEGEIVFQTEHLTYAYGEKTALADVSITIRRGETVALVGANGSGKSTLVNLLLQVYRPFSGKIFFCGQNYEEMDQELLRRHVGTFFQDFYLFHMPVWENVGFGDVTHVADVEKVDSALAKAGCRAFVNRLPKGRDSYIYRDIEETGVNFSGGEQQKLAVARAHMSDKDILIFDEPSSMLDPISELDQFRNIHEKIKGRTAILISHRVGFARLADKIILLSEGRVAETGTHEELMNQNGLYAQFFQKQAMWYQQEGEEADA